MITSTEEESRWCEQNIFVSFFFYSKRKMDVLKKKKIFRWRFMSAMLTTLSQMRTFTLWGDNDSRSKSMIVHYSTCTLLLTMTANILFLKWQTTKSLLFTLIVSSGWPATTVQTPPTPPAIKSLAALGFGFGMLSCFCCWNSEPIAESCQTTVHSTLRPEVRDQEL